LSPNLPRRDEKIDAGRFALSRCLERDAPEEQRVGIARVELQRLGEKSHGFSERAAFVADKAEKCVSVGSVRGDIDQASRLCLGAVEMDRVRTHSGAQLGDPQVST
jgi:hypothetical protein